jgi:hypothetical protein
MLPKKSTFAKLVYYNNAKYKYSQINPKFPLSGYGGLSHIDQGTIVIPNTCRSLFFTGKTMAYLSGLSASFGILPDH